MKSEWRKIKSGRMRKERREGAKERGEGGVRYIIMIKTQQPVNTFSMAAYTLSPLSSKVMATSELPVTALANTWTHAMKQY